MTQNALQERKITFKPRPTRLFLKEAFMCEKRRRDLLKSLAYPPFRPLAVFFGWLELKLKPPLISWVSCAIFKISGLTKVLANTLELPQICLSISSKFVLSVPFHSSLKNANHLMPTTARVNNEDNASCRSKTCPLNSEFKG